MAVRTLLRLVGGLHTASRGLIRLGGRRRTAGRTLIRLGGRRRTTVRTYLQLVGGHRTVVRTRHQFVCERHPVPAPHRQGVARSAADAVTGLGPDIVSPPADASSSTRDRLTDPVSLSKGRTVEGRQFSSRWKQDLRR